MIRRATRFAGWLTIAAGCGLPLSWFAPALPPSIQIALGLYALLALLRPFEALMIFAGLGPVSGALLPLAGSRYGGGVLMEVMILTLLTAGALRMTVRRDSSAWTDFEWALVAFAALVVGSCVSQWAVMALRAGVSEPVSASSALLLRSYFDRSVELRPVQQTVQLIEGLALAALTARLITAERGLRLASAVLIGAAGAAALNIQRFFELALRQPSVLQAIASSIRNLRVSTQYGDVNAAGSYFAMTAIMCVALARTGSGRRALALLLLPVISAGLWLAGSRVALAAGLICGTWMLALDYRVLAVRRRRVVILGAVVLLLSGVVAMHVISPPEGQTRFGYAVFARTELLKTGFRMLADRPLFGVGISQFYDLFPRYSSVELREAFATSAVVPVTRENAHNNLMQILAELGIAGLAAFCLVLVTALRRSREASRPPWRMAALFGLAAFLLTCLGGHPLLTPMVAFPFWLALGLAASVAAPLAAVHGTYLRRSVVTAMVLMVATLPARAGYERRDANLDGVTIGFSRWEQDEGGNRFRTAGDRSAFFAASSSRFVKVPLRSPDSRQRRVRLRLDGRDVSEVLVPPGRWYETRLVLPPDRDGPKFRRVDLIVQRDEGDPPDRAILVGRPIEGPVQE